MQKSTHLVLSSHPDLFAPLLFPIQWHSDHPKKRGPVVATTQNHRHRNSIGTHGGSYGIYRALAEAAGKLPNSHKPDFSMTHPIVSIGPFASWSTPEKIVSLDPWGATVQENFQSEIQAGVDIRPSIAITQAHIHMPELSAAIDEGRLKIDGKIIRSKQEILVTKAAIEPVWYLPGIAKRFKITEGQLRKALFSSTAGMYPELITRPDLSVFLPPIGGASIYLFGDPALLNDSKTPIAARVHDECNGSDVFGSDICTCRPYLTHGIEEAIQMAQANGLGIIIYLRKEGRALGEVTKFLVYNARKRQEGGDSAQKYFHRTECVAGVQDMRFQDLMPDLLHWLGLQKIDRFVSMSDMKYNAIVDSGITIHERISIPDHLIPKDAQVEMEAKKAAGYFSGEAPKNAKELDQVKGRDFINA